MVQMFAFHCRSLKGGRPRSKTRIRTLIYIILCDMHLEFIVIGVNCNQIEKTFICSMIAILVLVDSPQKLKLKLYEHIKSRNKKSAITVHIIS